LDWLVAIPRLALLARPAVAADLLGRARLAIPPGDPRRDHVTARLGAVLQMLRRMDDLFALGSQALHGMTDPAAAGEFAWHLTRGYQSVPGHNDEGVALIDAFLDRTDPGPPWRSRLLAQRAVLVSNSGRTDEARRHVAEAIEAGDRDGDPVSVGLALNAQLQFSDPPEAVEVVDRALALPFGDDPHSIDIRVVLLANRLVALLNLRRWQEFETALAATVAEAERVGTPRLTEVQWTASSYYFNVGDWDRSLLYASQIDIHTARQALGVRGNMALVHAHRAETELAAEQIAAVADIPYLEQMIMMIAAMPLIEAQALLAEAEGDLARAARLLSVWLDPQVDASPHARGLPTIDLVMLARIALAGGDTALAHTTAEKARQRAEQSPEVASYSRAIHGMVTGDPLPLLAAIDDLNTENETFHAAVVAEEAAVALARRGDQDAARGLFARAASEYEIRGAANELRRIQARLRPFGLQRGSRTARRKATSGWEALTEAELKVVRLVAEGHTNSEIGARLFVSRRTVETHVAHALRKLQLRSRIDIRLAAMTQSPLAGTP
jgi:DNA-binding NarL/FixJ family response regulator